MEGIALRAIGSLLLVLGLMGVVLYLLKKYVGRKHFSPITKDSNMKIIGILHLQPRKAIYLIQVINKLFVIGLAGDAMYPIAELSDEESLKVLSSFNDSSQTKQKNFSAVLSEYMSSFGWKGKSSLQSFDAHNFNL